MGWTAGIGTYVENQISNSSSGGMFIRLKSFFTTSLDQAIGTSFVHHVIAGYKFIMRYYNDGDKIYIFGFSRGAYTARFLAEMISEIGLLSRGNEEMVKFAWSTFSDYQRSKKGDTAFRNFMDKFSRTFCREKAKVHFLGLFDCVNSVGQFEIPFFYKSSPYIPDSPAVHIRHAVSIHERRLKFKPALFILDPSRKPTDDIKEVWFAGNHADIGGGWHCNENDYLLSDIALKWMVDEILKLKEDENALAWQKAEVDGVHKHEAWAESGPLLKGTAPKDRETQQQSIKKLVHDMLVFGGGASAFATCCWWVLGKFTLLLTPFMIRTINNSFPL